MMTVLCDGKWIFTQDVKDVKKIIQRDQNKMVQRLRPPCIRYQTLSRVSVRATLHKTVWSGSRSYDLEVKNFEFN